MNTDLSMVSLVTQASVLVQLVMLALLATSLVSWYFIIRKRSQLSAARKTADSFEETFWAGAI